MYFRTCRTRGRLKYKLSSVESLMKKVIQQIIFCYSWNFILVTQTVIHHKKQQIWCIFFPRTVRIFNLNLIRIFYYLRTAKNYWMTVPFMCNFQSLSNKFRTIFWSLIFHISHPRLDYFSNEKGNLNFRIQKCDGERNQKTFHFRNALNCI